MLNSNYPYSGHLDVRYGWERMIARNFQLFDFKKCYGTSTSSKINPNTKWPPFLEVRSRIQAKTCHGSIRIKNFQHRLFEGGKAAQYDHWLILLQI